MTVLQRLAGNVACATLLGHDDAAEGKPLDVQLAPDGEGAIVGSPPAPDAAAIIGDAETALLGGTGEFFYFAADPEWQSSFVMFKDPAVERVFRLLLERWFGGADAIENSRSIDAPPPWVEEFRVRALNVRRPRKGAAAPAVGQPADEEGRLADLAMKLANSVVAETPVQKIRRQFVGEADRRIGSQVMSQEAIDAMRAGAKGSGKLPDFTTCVDFFIQVVGKVSHDAGLETPLVDAPLKYLEINPGAKENFPSSWRQLGDAWVPFTPDTPDTRGPRPRPGDMPVFDFAKAGKSSRGVKHEAGQFSHVAILRSIEPLGPGEGAPSEPGAEGSAAPAQSTKPERWIVVEGGSAAAEQTACTFHPLAREEAPGKKGSAAPAGLIERPGKALGTIRGWIDAERAAAAALAKKR